MSCMPHLGLQLAQIVISLKTPVGTWTGTSMPAALSCSRLSGLLESRLMRLTSSARGISAATR